jgi:hypothetical protein
MTLFSAKFKDLVANEMEETAGRFNKKIMQKKKEARGRPLWNELKTKVERERARGMRSNNNTIALLNSSTKKQLLSILCTTPPMF